MPTDERIREVFHARVERALAGVTAPKDLPGAVRRDLRRARRRRAAVLMPVVAAALMAGTVAAAAIWSGTDQVRLVPSDKGPTRATAPPVTTPGFGPTVSLFDHAFVLPNGFRVTDRSGAVDLGAASPPQPVSGHDQSFTAEDGQRSLDVVVYRGPIAAAESELQHPRPEAVEHTKIAGHPATIDPYGTSPRCGVGDNSANASRRTTGLCSYESAALDVLMLETRVRLPGPELVLVQSTGVSRDDVIAVLSAALSPR